MKITFNTINFKGYDAVPLKRLFIDANYSKPILTELEEIAKQEKFKVKETYDFTKWNQDDKIIIEKNKKPRVICNSGVSEAFMNQLDCEFNISSEEYGYLTGGNTFIGKYPDGEKWMLIGEDEKKYCSDINEISKKYNINTKNIHFLPQQDFHLDMYLRPISYPYILVNDPKLVEENIKTHFKEKDEEYLSSFRHFCFTKLSYCTSDETIEKLKSLGFVPIPIAGVYNEEINFMNAIVNKHPDGKISYITNSTKTKEDEFKTQIEKIFENDLRKKVPFSDKIYFIEGKDASNYRYTNYIMSSLKYGMGGIHCMTLEEPNFKTWK